MQCCTAWVCWKILGWGLISLPCPTACSVFSFKSVYFLPSNIRSYPSMIISFYTYMKFRIVGHCFRGFPQCLKKPKLLMGLYGTYFVFRQTNCVHCTAHFLNFVVLNRKIKRNYPTLCCCLKNWCEKVSIIHYILV